MKFTNLWHEPENYTKKYHIIDNTLSAVTHGIGCCLAILGLVFLIIKAISTGSTIRIVSFTIYGTCLIILYLFSTLFHSLIFTRARNVFQIFDHSSIFLLIAGSYTPYSLVALQGTWGWAICILIWSLAAIGIIYYIIARNSHPIFDTILYIIMGWLIIISARPLYSYLGTTGFWLLVWGGIAYTFGAVLYTMKHIPFIHVIWHLFVMLGSILMYFSILLYV